MILLITPSARAQDCAKALHEATQETTQVADTLRQALAHLRAQEFSAVVIDQSFLETEPDESETVLEHIGMAIPVHINFAISGMERLIREIRAALYRPRSRLYLLDKAPNKQNIAIIIGPILTWCKSLDIYTIVYYFNSSSGF